MNIYLKILLSTILFFSISCIEKKKIKSYIHPNIEKIRDTTRIYSFKSNDLDSTKLGFESNDSFDEGVVSIAFIDSNNLVLADFYYNNLKFINISGNKAYISKVISFPKNIDFKIEECFYFENKLFLIEHMANSFSIFDLRTETFSYYGFSSPKVDAVFCLTIKDNNLLIACNYDRDMYPVEEKFDYYSFLDKKYYRNDQLKYDSICQESSFSYIHFLKSLKKESRRDSLLYNSYLENTHLITGMKINEKHTKYAIIKYNDATESYDLIIIE